jgi:hypothetical protein
MALKPKFDEAEEFSLPGYLTEEDFDSSDEFEKTDVN